MKSTKLMDRPVPDLDDWADWIMSINVDLERMESVTRNEQLQPSGPKKTIPRLPANIREKVAPQYWEPRLLNLGPYHANDEDSHCKQIKKRVFLYSLKKYGKPIEAYVEALHGMAQDLKNAYEELDLKNAYEELDPRHFQTERDFLIVMIVDGCVLVEILLELGNFAFQHHNSDHPLWDGDGSSHSDLAEKYKHDMICC